MWDWWLQRKNKRSGWVAWFTTTVCAWTGFQKRWYGVSWARLFVKAQNVQRSRCAAEWLFLMNSGIKWSVNTKNCVSLCWCLLFQGYLLRVSLLRRLLLQSGDGDAGSGCGSGRQSGGFGFHLWPAGALLVGAQAVVADVVRHLVQLLSQLLLLQVHLLPLRERRGAGGSRRSLVGFRGTEERICGWEKRSVCLCLSEGRRCDGASGCFQERKTDERVLAALDRSSKLFLQSLSRRSFTVAHAFLTLTSSF